MRRAYFLLLAACSGTRHPPPPPPTPSATVVAASSEPPPPAPSPVVVDSGPPPPQPSSSVTDITDLFPPAPISVTAETKCNADNDCVISHRCCTDEVTNRLHAPGDEKDCGIKKCPAMVMPPIIDKKCCAHACTPIFKKGQSCPAG